MKKNIKLSPMNTSLKSVFHSLVLLVIGGLVSMPTHAQHRYADLRVKIIDPAPNSIVYSPGYISYTFEVVNQGPDSLWPKDTIVYEMVHTGGGGRPQRRVQLNKYVVPEDSFIIHDSIYIDYFRDEDDFEIRLLTPLMFSSDYGDRDLWSEFYEDMLDNRDRLPLRHRRSLSVGPPDGEVARVYPNPCITGRLTLEGTGLLTHIQITDVLGRMVDYTIEEYQPKQVVLSVSPRSSGMHLLQYQSGNHTIHQKVYFIHP